MAFFRNREDAALYTCMLNDYMKAVLASGSSFSEEEHVGIMLG